MAISKKQADGLKRIQLEYIEGFIIDEQKKQRGKIEVCENNLKILELDMIDVKAGRYKEIVERHNKDWTKSKDDGTPVWFSKDCWVFSAKIKS